MATYGATGDDNVVKLTLFFVCVGDDRLYQDHIR